MTDQPLLDRIVIDPKICHGKPLIRGLRYPVEVILAAYEDLEREGLLAVLAFAARLSRVKQMQPLQGRMNFLVGARATSVSFT